MAKQSPPLQQRLRALADRLDAGEALPRGVERNLVAALDLWEADAPRPKPAPNPATVSGAGPIQIWSDGSCAPNPGPGGWGAIVEAGGQRQELSGAESASTNNIMEMTAAIEALRHTPEGSQVRVTTDSQYLKNGITQWIRGWKRNGWKTASKSPVKNQDLWRELDRLVGVRSVTWHWVAGHSGHAENDRCDELANAARHSLNN
jgi:ribonuclease HI